MSGLKQFWQTLIQRFSPRVPWSASDLDREFSAARQERQHLLGQLSDLQAEFEQRVSAGQRERQDLLDQLTALHARVEQELTASGLEKQALRGELYGLRSEVAHGLEAAQQEQHGLLGQLSALQSEVAKGLAAVHEEQRGLQERLSTTRGEVESNFSVAREERRALRGELGKLQVERDAANQEIIALRRQLTDAGTRQESTDRRVNSLEMQLEGQRQEHDSALQQALIRERDLGHRLTVAMTVAAAAFVLVIVGSAINFWEAKNTTRLLDEVSQGIQHIQTTIAGQSSADVSASRNEKPPTASKDRGLPDVSQLPQPGAGSASGVAQDTGSGSVQQFPAPDLMTSKSPPRGDHNFKHTQDARPVGEDKQYRENHGKQEGMVPTPGGLQDNLPGPATAGP